MPVKESSDELNPPVVTSDAVIARAPGRRSALDYLALGIATCGVGFLPLAPGTWGSIVGVAIFLLWEWLRLRFFSNFWAQYGFPPGVITLWTVLTLGLVFGVTMAGIWASSRVEKVLGRKDPGVVVIDEVAGQLITFLFIPVFSLPVMWPFIIIGFILFRLFDIWKPYPIGRLEALESGLGIMADDVLAGAYAAMCLSLLTAIYLLSFWRSW